MRILGIFRGFPGLGRVVAGVSLLEELRDQYGANIRMISYLQGNEYLKSKGYADLHEATPMDYCSINGDASHYRSFAGFVQSALFEVEQHLEFFYFHTLIFLVANLPVL